jgi:hypothetical protein
LIIFLNSMWVMTVPSFLMASLISSRVRRPLLSASNLVNMNFYLLRLDAIFDKIVAFFVKIRQNIKNFRIFQNIYSALLKNDVVF